MHVVQLLNETAPQHVVVCPHAIDGEHCTLRICVCEHPDRVSNAIGARPLWRGQNDKLLPLRNQTAVRRACGDPTHTTITRIAKQFALQREGSSSCALMRRTATRVIGDHGSKGCDPEVVGGHLRCAATGPQPAPCDPVVSRRTLMPRSVTGSFRSGLNLRPVTQWCPENFDATLGDRIVQIATISREAQQLGLLSRGHRGREAPLRLDSRFPAWIWMRLCAHESSSQKPWMSQVRSGGDTA